MENKNKNWDQIKQEYKEHTMSEEQVLAMKEKIKQAKKENRRKQTSHLRRKITGAAAAIGTKRHHRFAGEVVALQKRKNCHWRIAPPNGVAHQ